MEELILLLEQYKKRINTLKSMKGLDIVAETRLKTKASCYRTIISELEKIIKN